MNTKCLSTSLLAFFWMSFASAAQSPECYRYDDYFSEITKPVNIVQNGLKLTIAPKYSSLILQYTDSSKTQISFAYGDSIIDVVGNKIRAHLDSASWGGPVDGCGNKMIHVPGSYVPRPNEEDSFSFNIAKSGNSSGVVLINGQWREVDDDNVMMRLFPTQSLTKSCFVELQKFKYIDGEIEERCFEFYADENLKSVGVDSDSWGGFTLNMDILGGNVDAHWVSFFESGKIQTIRFVKPQWLPIIAKDSTSAPPQFASFTRVGFSSPGVIWYGTLAKDVDLLDQSGILQHFNTGNIVIFDSKGSVEKAFPSLE